MTYLIDRGNLARLSAEVAGPVLLPDDEGYLTETAIWKAEALITTAGPGVDTPVGLIEIRQLGGALGREPRVPNAVGDRDAAFQFSAAGFGAPGMAEEFRAPLAGLADAMVPWATGRKQVNFLTGDDTTAEAVARAYEPDTYHRLVGLKRAFDPSNMFRINHNIRPGR